jgi:hypothetical protein
MVPDRCKTHPTLSEGAAVYALGLVVIATHPGRFWLGMGLASVPIVVGLLLKSWPRRQ